MTRYDLRHAAVQEGPDERISLTFRSCVHAERLLRARVGRSLPASVAQVTSHNSVPDPAGSVH